MSENDEESKSGSRNLAADLRLRPERPPVTRLSRKELVGLAAVAAILISGALIWGLYALPPTTRQTKPQATMQRG